MGKKYQVFLSFKHHDQGAETKDFEMASRLHRILTAKGLNVFFSERTIQEMGESDYQAMINSALDDVDLLIVVCTNVDYINTNWVEYEWSSFHNDIRSNRKPNARIISFTDNVDINSMPRALRDVQNYNLQENGYERITEFVLNYFGIDEDRFIKGMKAFKSQGSVPDYEIAYSIFSSSENQRCMLMTAIMHHQGLYVAKDTAKATAIINNAGKFDEPDRSEGDALWVLGKIYDLGIGVETDKASARSYYKKSADAGSCLGCYDYAMNDGTPDSIKYLKMAAESGYYPALKDAYLALGNDDTASIGFLSKSAELGDPDSMFYLASLYEQGKTVGKNLKRAVELYETSCSKGNSSAKEATVRLSDTGFLEKSGDIANGEEKYDDAFFYFNRGYELKDPECTFKLAQLYLNGQGVTRSADECIKLLKESSDAGHKESTLQLGRMYLQGNDIVRNIDTAVMLLKKAATQGSSDACLELGGILESDDSTVEEALVWYNKGSEMGSLECKDKAIKLQKQISESKMSPQDSLDRAKVLLESGDKDEALRLLNKASDGGYAEAKFIIGEMYFNGCILPRSEKDAIKFIKESADLGYSKSQTFLANLYLRGRGVPRSLSDAIRLFESASASGDVEAIKSLAAMYNRGEGVQRSVEKAAEMYEMAANAGDAESQFITGCNYQNGKGVGKSEEIAIKWLKAAYENGVKEAKVQLRMLRINEV